MEKSRKLVKQYYSCYPFLFQIAILWLNHFPLAKKEEQSEILKQISALCDHITDNCKDMGLCSDTMVLKAGINLQLGNAQDTIDTLADILRPERLANQSDSLLIQAYMLIGNSKKADGFTQLSMYSHLLSLIQGATMQIMMPGVSLSLREETIFRIKKLIDIYKLEKLHPNFVFQFFYSTAIFYAENHDKESTIYHLQKCSLCITNLLCEKEFALHGDDYFTMLESQFEEFDFQTGAPRNRSLVLKDIKHLYDHPAFAFLADEPEYQKLKNKLMEVQ